MSIYTTDSSWPLGMKLNLFRAVVFHRCLFVSRSAKVNLRDVGQAVKTQWLMHVLRSCFNIETERSAHPVYLSLSCDSQNKHR